MPSSICPYLGNKLDSDTAMAYSGPDNRCYRSGKPLPISIHHQDMHCLSPGYSKCPIYLHQTVSEPLATQNEKKNKSTQSIAQPVAPSPLPGFQKQKTEKEKPGHKRNFNLPKIPTAYYRYTGIFMAGLIIFIGLLWVLGSQWARAQSPSPTYTIPQVPTSAPTTVNTEVIPIVNPIAVEDTATPVPTATNTPTHPATTVAPSATKKNTGTSTITASATRTLTVNQPTATICGVPYGWVKYIVKSGDTLSKLSVSYQVSVVQLQAANCMGSSTTLYAGTVIYVPYIPPTNTVVPPTSTPTSKPASPTSTATQAPPTATDTQEPTVTFTDVVVVPPTEVIPEE